MKNAEIARIFHDIADLLEIRGDNPFRVRSYRNAAQAIEGLAESLDAMVKEDGERIETVPGIGKSLHAKVVEIVTSGSCSFMSELLTELPAGLLDMLQLQGVGPKKVQLLYRRLGITSVEELYGAAKSHKLHDLPGMGEKSEEKILKAIVEMKAREGRFRISRALPYANALIEELARCPGVADITLAGSLRRWRETVGDIDILAICEEGSPIMDHFTGHADVKEVVASGATKSSVVMGKGCQVDLRVLERDAFGAALLYFTGSKEHNVALRERAKKRGLRLSEYGLFREEDEVCIARERERDVYDALDLEWIAPEIRENRGEIEAADEGRLPSLIEARDLRGDLHMHTTASDGASSIEEMAEAAMARGYEYIAITDHSKSLTIAHGLDEGRVALQIEEIDTINDRFSRRGIPFTILKGIEVDIKADGSLDLDEDTLGRLDVVVGAVHSKFTMGEEEMTERMLTAIGTGCLHIVAHPTGRIVGGREPYPVSMKRLMEGAKRAGVALELNSFPDRLDLNDVHLRLARETGVMVALSTDAHAAFHLENITFGIHTARRGWIEKDNVLNTRPLNELLPLLERGTV